MAVLETDSSILQMERTRLGGPVNVFKGRAAILAGGMGRQDPYETQQGETQGPTRACNDKGLGTDWLGRDQVSYESAMKAGKEGQQHLWRYDQ